MVLICASRRLVLHDPSEYVEVVDQHVLEDAARTLDVVDGRCAGIAAGHDQHFRIADLALRDPLLQRCERGIVATLKADQAGHARRANGLCAGARALELEVDRLLAEDRLAGLRRPQDEVRVRIGRRPDDDGRDGGVTEDGLGGARLRTVLLRELRRRGGIDIDDVFQPDAGLPRDIAGVDRPDPARAKQCDIDHLALHRIGRKSGSDTQ